MVQYANRASTYLLHQDPELNNAPVADGNVLGGDEMLLEPQLNPCR